MILTSIYEMSLCEGGVEKAGKIEMWKLKILDIQLNK